MGVEVARRFDGRFTRGFTVTAVEAERVWVRRHSDGAVLGAFALSEV